MSTNSDATAVRRARTRSVQHVYITDEGEVITDDQVDQVVEEMLSVNFPPVMLAGCEYEVGPTLRKVDPDMFACCVRDATSEWVEAEMPWRLLDAAEDDGERVAWVEATLVAAVRTA